MENQELTFTREVLENTVSFVAASMENVERNVSVLLDRQKRAASISSKKKERLLALLEEMHLCSTMSVRRSLLHYLADRNCDVDDALYEFADEAENEELNPYASILLSQIDDHNPIWQTRFAELLSTGCWIEQKGKRYTKCELTKEAAFELGHTLRFSAEEMEAFLVRTMEDGGFNFTSSDDIVHFFCFISNRSQQEATEMLEEFKKFAQSDTREKLKLKEKEHGFTEAIRSTLNNTAYQWLYAQDDRAEFMKWLKGQAPALDVHSQAAHDLFYRLAHYYVELCRQRQNCAFSADAKQISYDIMDIIDDNTELHWSADEAEQLCKAILLGVGDATGTDDTEWENCYSEWYCLHRKPNGSVGKLELGDRIFDVLTGKKAVSKADLLTMLFSIFEMPYDYDDIDPLRWASEYMGFARQILKKAHMTFYLPHFLEYSFISSLVSQSPLENLLFEEKIKQPAPAAIKKKDEKNALRRKESDLVKFAAEQFVDMASSAQLQPTVSSLTAYFENRAAKDQVIFLSNGTVCAFSKMRGLGETLCPCFPLAVTDAAQIRQEAEVIYQNVYATCDPKKELAIAKKLYMMIIAQGIRKTHPELDFGVCATSNMLLTLKK